MATSQLQCVVVDDDTLILQLVENTLCGPWRDRMAVALFDDPYKAHRHVLSSPCDLLITDLEMPQLSGLELIVQCRQLSPWMQSLIISSHTSVEFLSTAATAGASDYILKPLSPEVVLDRVERAVERVQRWKHVLSSAVARQWT